MLTTTLTLALMLATPDAAALADAQQTAAALASDMDDALRVSTLLTSRRQQAIVLTALLCEAQLRKVEAEDKLETLLGADILAAKANASRDVKRAKMRLQVMSLAPLSCDAGPVDDVVQCLHSLTPSVRCTEDDNLATQARAATSLAGVL